MMIYHTFLKMFRRRITFMGVITAKSMKPHASFTRNYIEGFMTQTRRIKSLGLNKYWKFSFSLDYYLEWLDDFIIGNNFKGTAKEN